MTTDLLQRLLQVLAEADPLLTELDLDSRLDEYGMEAGDIARQLALGEPLEDAVVAVFRDTCEIELEPETVARIVALYG